MEYNSGKKDHKKIQNVKKLSIEQYKAKMSTTRTVRFGSDKKIPSNSHRNNTPNSLSERQIQQALSEDEIIPGLQDDSSSNQEMNIESLNEKIFMAATKSPNYLEKKENAVEEPEILTLSSDDDDDEPSNNSSHHTPGGHCGKEPVILKNIKYPHYLDSPAEDVGSVCVSMNSRSIRVGSHKFIPTKGVYFSKHSIKFMAPVVVNSDQQIDVHVPMACVIKILCSLEPGYTSIFVYCTPQFASHLCHQLHLKDHQGPYFDPCSDDETKKRLVIFVDKISEELISHFRDLYKHRRSFINNTTPLLEELTKKEMKNIMKCFSPDVHNLLKKTSTIELFTKTLLIYPHKPSRGRITINEGDYKCLGDEQFLNDVVIDFYLKWLHLEKLPEVYRTRTHVFSTFFYKRLTAKPKKERRADPHEMDESLTHAQKRHARVKSWTKGINIFEKDFVLIPINERSHWFMAVICYPGIQLKTAENCSQQPTTPKRQSSRARKKPHEQLILDIDWSDRDEAESDEELNGIDEFRDGKFGKKPQNVEHSVQSVKHPCILIFDSLKGSNRSRIVSTLREYLAMEYEERTGVARKFTTFNMEGFLPQVPQQLNYSDCGVYMLQFAECFFESPIKNYKLPIRNLENWFPQEVVLGKRESIAKLIQSLIRQANIPNRHPIPEIKFPMQKQSSPSPSDSLEQREAAGERKAAITGNGKKCHADEELQGNDFHPINILAGGATPKKISVKLSSKTIASSKDMRAELDKYITPHVNPSLDLIQSSYMDSADNSLTDDLEETKIVPEDDIYGDLDANSDEKRSLCRDSDESSSGSSTEEEAPPPTKKVKLSSPRSVIMSVSSKARLSKDSNQNPR